MILITQDKVAIDTRYICYFGTSRTGTTPAFQEGPVTQLLAHLTDGLLLKIAQGPTPQMERLAVKIGKCWAYAVPFAEVGDLLTEIDEEKADVP